MINDGSEEKVEIVDKKNVEEYSLLKGTKVYLYQSLL